jgi:hypothetical protein
VGGFLAAKRWGGPPVADRPSRAEETAGEPQERLVHIAHIQRGNEADVRRLIERFPVMALSTPGIAELNAFVGSAYVILEYGFRGEFAAVFGAFRADPAVAAYLEELGHLLDDAPAPLPEMTGGQSLASQALHWDRAAGISFTPHVRPKDSEPA